MWPPLTLEKGEIICNFLFPFSPPLSGVADVVFSELNVEEVMAIAAVFILPHEVHSSFQHVPPVYSSASSHFSCGDVASWTDGGGSRTRGGLGGGLLEQRPLGFHIFTGRTHILKGDPCGCSHTKEGRGGGGG